MSSLYLLPQVALDRVDLLQVEHVVPVLVVARAEDLDLQVGEVQPCKGEECPKCA